MDEDMSPSFLSDVFWDWGRGDCGRCLDCSWAGEDVLVVGGFLVEIDSYAIAFSTMRVSGGVTRWGLFLMRGVHIFSPSL